MKAGALGWLLEPRAPPVRLHALTDVLYHPSDNGEVVSTRKIVSSYGPVRKILRAQTSGGYWPPENTCYRPKYTATAWPLILLGEVGVPAEPRIKTVCEHFFNLHQMGKGAFSWVSNRDKRMKMEE